MKKTLILAMMMMVGAASAHALDMEGNWCSVVQDGALFTPSTDFTHVMKIDRNGGFESAVVGVETGYAQERSYLRGYIVQGASSADMQPSLGPKFQEAERVGNDLELIFTDGSVSRYSECESEAFIRALGEAREALEMD